MFIGRPITQPWYSCLLVGLYNRCTRLQQDGVSVENCRTFADLFGESDDVFPVAWQVSANTKLNQQSVPYKDHTQPR